MKSTQCPLKTLEAREENKLEKIELRAVNMNIAIAATTIHIGIILQTIV